MQGSYMRGRVFSAFPARFAKESTGGIAVIPCSHKFFARIHHSYVVMSYELFVLVCTIVNFSPANLCLYSELSRKHAEIFQRWSLDRAPLLHPGPNGSNATTQSDLDTERGERNTWCPKENDFFVVPRSDELLAAESSAKPELVELSAGDSWQQAMALRQLSVTVGLGTVLFI